MRLNIASGSPWEAEVGYSRAVRVGNQVFVSGTTASDEYGNVVGPGDPYAQTCYILKKIDLALRKAGASSLDVVRTRIFVADVSQWREIGRAHKEHFGEISPATTMVEVKALIDPAYLVEIEVDAVICPIQ